MVQPIRAASTTESVLAIIVTRPPYRMRLRMSRPNSSVPNGLAAEGGRSRCPMFWRSGLRGASSGAAMAASSSSATIARPSVSGQRRRIQTRMPPRRPWRAATRPAGTSAVAAVGVVVTSATTRLRQPDARVQDRIEQVHEQVDDDERRRDQEDDPGGDLIVAVEDGGQDQ